LPASAFAKNLSDGECKEPLQLQGINANNQARSQIEQLIANKQQQQ
jgi:hypothetical protein